MKVYVVEYFSGNSYDSSQWIEKIFSNYEDAERFKRESEDNLIVTKDKLNLYNDLSNSYMKLENLESMEDIENIEDSEEFKTKFLSLTGFSLERYNELQDIIYSGPSFCSLTEYTVE